MIQILKQSLHTLNRFWLLTVLLSGICLLFVVPTSVYAAQTSTAVKQSRSSAQVQHHTTQTSSGHATIIILDMSGSMGSASNPSQGNDPLGYRCSAADSYIDLSGTNDYVGLIGLVNNNGNKTNDGLLAASVWTAQPLATDIAQSKDNLKKIIVSSSNNCTGNGYTPTYDALDQAYNQLNGMQVVHSHQIGGSVILLTDGAPCSDVDRQINGIQNTLLPKFSRSGWPIDTIGLGQDASINSASTGCPGTLPGTFHDFLKNISNSTGGNFYDDGHGQLPGVNPLNIAPFFATIFSKYSGESLTQDVPPTQLNGTQRQNFTVIDGTNKLGVLVICDSLNTQVTLTDSQGHTIPLGTDNQRGVFSRKDGYSTVYTITGSLSPGQWILSVSGSGNYLMYDFQQTSIGATVDSIYLPEPGGANIVAPAPLPLGQTLRMTAHVTSNGQPLNDSTYVVYAYIAYNSVSNDCTQASGRIKMDVNGGTYTTTFSEPESSPAGTYNILLCVTSGDAGNAYASTSKSVGLELFPSPYFVSASGQLIDATTPAPSTVIQWPTFFQWLYSLPIANGVSGWPLQGTSALPQVHDLTVTLLRQGQPYTDATINTVQVVGPDNKSVAASVSQVGPGKFALRFIPPVNGLYMVKFQTGGSFKDSHGQFGLTTRQATVTIKSASANWVWWATGITGFYVLLLIILGLIINFFRTPPVSGRWVRDGSAIGGSFAKTSRGPLAFLHRNYLRSAQTRPRLPPGLLFRFGRGGEIQVRPEEGNNGRYWKQTNGTPLQNRFQRVSKLIFAPGQTGQSANAEPPGHFTFISDPGRGGPRGGQGANRGGRGNKNSRGSGNRTPARGSGRSQTPPRTASVGLFGVRSSRSTLRQNRPNSRGTKR